MKLDAPHNEISYHSTTGSTARFILTLDGEATMHILCDTEDPKKVIRIAPAGRPDLEQATKGRFQITTKLLEDADGAPLGTETRVDRISVYKYVIPRMHVLLGRLLRAA